MNKTHNKIDALLAKHPNLSKEEAIKIFAEKNERKKKKRSAKTEKINARMLKNEKSQSESSANSHMASINID